MAYIIKKLILVTAIGALFYSCNHERDNTATVQPGSIGVLNAKTQFYDSNGNSIFLGPMKIWYYDSVAIEEIVTIKTVTDTLKRTTVSFVPQFYKYIDLKNNSWYDYKTFNDTAQIIKSGVLQDSIFLEGGWTFYVNHLRMKNQPEILPDTIIGPTKYMRIKFSQLKSTQTNRYIIGYLRCDNKAKLFSFEKIFSSKVNCTMTRYYTFKEGVARPFASNELEFLSDTLSEKELRVFNAWGKNQRNYPVH